MQMSSGRTSFHDSVEMNRLTIRERRICFFTVSGLVLFLVSYIVVVHNGNDMHILSIELKERDLEGRKCEDSKEGPALRDHKQEESERHEKGGPEAGRQKQSLNSESNDQLHQLNGQDEQEDDSDYETDARTDVETAKDLLPHDEQLSARLGHCNFNDGFWEYDEADPFYTNETCSLIPELQNCIRNGRPDSKFLYWRWKPRDCDLPRFNAEEFLRTFQGKTIGYVGDSIARNQMVSLSCLLSQAEQPTVIYESRHHKKYTFELHQVTVLLVWSPFLVRDSAESIQVAAASNISHVLHMDELEPKWASKLDEMDIVTVSIGQWYSEPVLCVNSDGTQDLPCSKCSSGHDAAATSPDADVKAILDLFRATLRMGLERMARSSEKARAVVVTTFNPSHFEDGDWRTGTCRREEPLRPEQVRIHDFGRLVAEMRDVVFEELNRILDYLQREADSGASLVSFDFIDITKVMMLRADAHAGPYRSPYPFAHLDPSNWVQNDCLHWCMPGPVDTWNQMLFHILRRYIH